MGVAAYVIVAPVAVFAAWVFVKEGGIWREGGWPEHANFELLAATAVVVVIAAIAAAVVG